MRMDDICVYYIIAYVIYYGIGNEHKMQILNPIYIICAILIIFLSCLISIFWLRCYDDVLAIDLKWLRFFKYKINYNYDIAPEEDKYNESE